ncbi:alanine racemase [Desulfoglaeba alkanexedens]|uniref:Alanine racemase n=1 Tax=Desulfoglaeba alkanexedens ALDC TaxID=980445 RepID=A0A4V1ERA4_9BACT|nr:alanine racemase [Desulfoglaeba alkanexedens]QCQ20951.1 alanine racemase [Desulfoglaeba alkanexedens ALDC]
MPMNWVEVDLAALRHNFSQLRERLLVNTEVMAVVKSDAYGHGMIPVARELVRLGVRFFGVSTFWEAVELRSHGIEGPVVVLLGIEEADLEEAVIQGIRPVVYRLDHARKLSETAGRLGRTAPFHLKVDTGMGRLGIPMDQLGPFLDILLKLPHLSLEGILSHFATADEEDKSYSDVQLEQFRAAIESLKERNVPVPYAHIANSAGILGLPHAHFQLVRPGLMLYGSPPSMELPQPVSLRPVMTFKSKIIQLKVVPPGRAIGYGRTFFTQRTSRIATVPVGYDDGYARCLSNRSQVLVAGRRVPVVGRVSMNMITIDVTDVPEARTEHEVVLLGPQGTERITAEEISRWQGTISYEIYCSIGRNRFKRFLNATPEGSSEAAPPRP